MLKALLFIFLFTNAVVAQTGAGNSQQKVAKLQQAGKMHLAKTMGYGLSKSEAFSTTAKTPKDFILECFNDNSTRVKKEAFRAAANSRDNSFVPEMIYVYKNAKGPDAKSLHIQIVRSLGKIGGNDVVSLYSEILDRNTIDLEFDAILTTIEKQPNKIYKPLLPKIQRRADQIAAVLQSIPKSSSQPGYRAQYVPLQISLATAKRVITLYNSIN